MHVRVCACTHTCTHVGMHASLLSGKTSFALTTQELRYTCVGVAGETDLRAHRSHQFVARVLVIAGYMECDLLAMVRVRVRVVAVAVVAPALRPM